ncbi:DNA repair photolyase [Ancylobacter rudongensis]|uniref:DNA repair photolyase n=2 Tax=Ancylobacter rudongensis TaxID=177413 RepID=A0A1G4RY22_9HYPH|nr:DNA repair photolyase [Ancylobacter rudongensis]
MQRPAPDRPSGPPPPPSAPRHLGRLAQQRRDARALERAEAARDLAGLSDMDAVAPAPMPDWMVEAERRRGRGALSNPAGRFEPHSRERFDDGWQGLDDLPPFRTSVTVEKPRTIINRNESPDVGFDRSINPYRGCEHGCVYCFARPTHAYQGLSAGLDFETKLFAKPDAPELLAKELAKPGYEPRTIALGINTDGYQPIEREWRLTRRILEVLRDFGHPVGIVTKSALVVRDFDILGPMAEKGLVKVALSITTLDAKLARIMEPRAATPSRRLDTLRRLSEAGVPTAVLVAPVIPAVTDAELERILDAAVAAGATEAGYVMLRVPLEIRDLFREWLLTHFPDRYRHVLSLLKELHGGREYDSTFGQRMTGTGPYAWTLARRFEIAAERLGLNRRHTRLTTRHFTRPPQKGEQLSLFGEGI